MAGRKLLAMSQASKILLQAKIRGYELVSNGSNCVFLVSLVKGDMEAKAIYKPSQGEVPLWDFPSGTLFKREYAAFIVSRALEWPLIPPTVIRNGPYGVGSIQWFIDRASSIVNRTPTNDTSALKQIALFDYLVNNADRKLGHFLKDRDGQLWVVDHGLTFNVVPKLRTVLWDFSGQTIPDELMSNVRALQFKLKPGKQLRDDLRRLLDESEINALEFRIDAIIEKPVFVHPSPHRSVPWPWY